MKKLLYALCVAACARCAASEAATPLNELDASGISMALQSKGIVIAAVDWGAKYSCPGYRTLHLKSLGFDRLRTPAPAGDAPVDLLLEGGPSLFAKTAFDSVGFVVDPGAYALSSYEIKYARSWLSSDVARRPRNRLIYDGKGWGGTFEVGAGEVIYLGNFSVNCEGRVLIPWRTYPTDEAAFRDYLGGLKSIFPALDSSRVRFRLFRTRVYGKDYYTERGREAEDTGNWTLAETDYERSQDESQKEYVTGPERARSAFNLARARGHVCKFDDAEKLMADALEKAEKSFGKASPTVTMILIESAWMNFDRGEFAKSLPYYEHGLRMVETQGVMVSDPIVLAGIYDEYATALDKTAKGAEAEIARRAAAEERAANPGLAQKVVPVRYQPSCASEPSPPRLSEAASAAAGQSGQPLFRGITPVYRPSFVYPSKALQAGIEGSVVANAYVSRDGSVSDVKILAADPPGWFEQDVVRMLKQWRFAPERTEFIVQVPFNFEFEN